MSSAAESTALGGMAMLSNKLACSSSSYVRSHKDNPVAWQQWSSSSISLARKSNRLIFLSVGYSACHWCHVMERESFSSPEIANVLNQSFVPIKVDREARPDIDEIYMSYVTATTGRGGWPLNVFLTPNLEPVFGGTYWPGPGSHLLPMLAARSDERLTFLDVLEKMRDVWSAQQERCIRSANEITRQLKDFTAEGNRSDSYAAGRDWRDPEPLDIDIIDDAVDHFVTRYDPVYGGFAASSSAPKFPTPPNLTFLLRTGASTTSKSPRCGFPDPIPSILGREACVLAASMSVHSLLAMSRGGLRDHLGYGFHRYSVTSNWGLPHFEKMLYDNAQLLCCYCDAWALSHDPEILGTIYSLVEYFTSCDSPIISEDGGFLASEDADSYTSKGATREQKREGAFYVWTLKELQATLECERDGNILARHYGVMPDGNVPREHDPHDEFIGQNVLHIAATPSVLAKEFGLPEPEIVKIIKDARQRLRAHRENTRPRPEVDEKVIASWNGLAISALCQASNTLRDIDGGQSQSCRLQALKTAQFTRKMLYDSGSHALIRYRSSRLPYEGDSNPAFLDDYACMTHACLALYEITFEEEWLKWADDLQDYVNTHFLSQSGGYNLISTPVSDPNVHRDGCEGERAVLSMDLKPGSDSAVPSPNGLVACNLLLLSSYLAESSYRNLAQQTINAFAIEIVQHPFLFVSMLSAIVLDAVGVKSVVVAGNAEAHRLTGFGRTVVKLLDQQEPRWLQTRNGLLRGLQLGAGERECVMICEAGTCRKLKNGELDPPSEKT